MKFSFVLPAYKGRYLHDSISSILNQDFRDFELIVVDDCSPDPIREIVANFNDKRLSYYRNEQNIGGKDLVAQWNHCLEYAKGDYVILATDDDLYEPNFLSTFVPFIAKYPDVELFRSRVLNVNSDNRILWIDRCYKEFLTPLEFRYHKMHGMLGGIPNYIFRKDALVKQGGFVSLPLAWGSDDLTAIAMAGKGVVTSQQHLVRFRWSDINISSDRKNTGLDKLRARLLQGQWLAEHPIENDAQGVWKDFYESQVIDYLSVYTKITLIEAMNAMTWRDWLKSIRLLHRYDRLTFRDRLSIVLRSLQNRI